MALLNRLFSSRKKSHKQGYVTFGKNENESWKPFNFSKEQVRVLLFRECDWRGRKLLFDSKAVQKTRLENKPCTKLKFGSRQKSENKKTDTFVEVTNGIGYQYMRPSSDVTVLGEMIFGSVAMSFQGTVFKVHNMKSPSRLMCTEVFHSPVTGTRSRGVSDRSLEDSCGSSINSMSEYFTSQGSCSDTKQANNGSGPLDIELRTKHYYSNLDVDSGFCGDASLQSASSVGSSGFSPGGLGTRTSSLDSRRSSGSFHNNQVPCHSGGSLSSLQRRWLRNMSTSLELGAHWTSRSTLNEVPNEDAAHPGHRRTKLGLAVVISLTPEEEKEMSLFLFEHMTVIEGMIARLRSIVERAYLHKEMFVHLMMEGCQDMQQWLLDVFSAPRLTCPVWLGLTSGFNHLNSALSYNFLQELCQLIAAIDTKATNFFVSTLVTAVLTHHLGWVATILPGKMPPHHISKKPCTGQLLDALSKSHPYNPLWAQLGELYGALGYPAKIAKTVVTSSTKKVDLLNKILSSLTYFIRCSEVEKRVVEKQEFVEKQTELDGSLSDTSQTTLVSEEPHHSNSLARNILSQHDMFDRIDHGVEIGRELKSEYGPYPSTCLKKQSDNRKLNISSTSAVPAEFEKSIHLNEHTTRNSTSVGSDGKNSLKNDHLSPKQAGGMRRTASFMNKLDGAPIKEQSNHSASQGSGRLYPSLADLQLIEATGIENDISVHSEDVLKKVSPDKVEDCKNKETVSLITSEEMFKKSVGICGNVKKNDLSGLIEEKSEKVNSVENNKNENGVEIRLEDISMKVRSLCRVPTKAILYHLQNEQNENKVKIEEMPYPKRVESERQRSSIKTVPVLKANNWPSLVLPDSSKSLSNSNQEYEEKNSGEDVNENYNVKTAKDVIFVLGDNEELVGLKQNKSDQIDKTTANKKNLGCEMFKTTSSLHVDSVDRIENVCKCDSTNKTENIYKCESVDKTERVCECISANKSENICERERTYHSIVLGSASDCHHNIKSSLLENECNSGNRLHLNISLGRSEFEKETVPFSTEQNMACKTGKNHFRVVTVRPSVIELEHECGGLKTDLSIDESVKHNKPVTRSQSLSCSLNGEKVRKKSSLCRRYSDCVCERNRYLKDYHSVRFNFERCEGVLMSYIEGRDQNKVVQRPNEKSDKITEARGNFCLSECSVTCENCSSTSKEASDYLLIDKRNDNCDMVQLRDDKPAGCYSINYSSTPKLSSEGVGEENAIFENCNGVLDEESSNSTRTEVEERETSSTVQPSAESVLELPVPRCVSDRYRKRLCGFAASLLGSISDHYIPDMVLQGCTQLPNGWETVLKRDLSVTAHHSLLDQEVSEAVCIVANIDTWEVQLVSSHTYVVDKPGTFGIRVGMSRLVANMLESLLYLWRLKTSPEHCLLHLESKLRELFLRSQAVAELLLTTEFCDMELLTTSLDLDANDVPLLLAVASTHTPQVTERYGLSFR